MEKPNGPFSLLHETKGKVKFLVLKPRDAEYEWIAELEIFVLKTLLFYMFYIMVDFLYERFAERVPPHVLEFIEDQIFTPFMIGFFFAYLVTKYWTALFG